MPITMTPSPHSAAEIHLTRALAFYERVGQHESALGELTAGLLAMSRQLARVELALMQAHEC